MGGRIAKSARVVFVLRTMPVMNDKQGARMTKSEMKALVNALGVQERVLLFCLASGTDWKQAGVTYKTVADMMTWPLMIRENGLVKISSVRRVALTDFGHAALRELL